MSMDFVIIIIGIAALIIVGILIFIIIRNKKKKEEIAMYQRPRMQSNAEGAYYEPEDNTMAPTAYGSMTYATNTYGQNLYGQEPKATTGVLNGSAGAAQKIPFVEEEDPSGLSMDFLRRSDEERWRREHESFSKPTTENHNPLYGTVPEKRINASNQYKSEMD